MVQGPAGIVKTASMDSLSDQMCQLEFNPVWLRTSTVEQPWCELHQLSITWWHTRDPWVGGGNVSVGRVVGVFDGSGVNVGIPVGVSSTWDGVIDGKGTIAVRVSATAPATAVESASSTTFSTNAVTV